MNNYEELKLWCDNQRLLAIESGKPIFTAVQKKREVVEEYVNVQESIDFLNKVTWHIESIPSNPDGYGETK